MIARSLVTETPNSGLGDHPVTEASPEPAFPCCPPTPNVSNKAPFSSQQRGWGHTGGAHAALQLLDAGRALRLRLPQDDELCVLLRDGGFPRRHRGLQLGPGQVLGRCPLERPWLRPRLRHDLHDGCMTCMTAAWPAITASDN